MYSYIHIHVFMYLLHDNILEINVRVLFEIYSLKRQDLKIILNF